MNIQKIMNCSSFGSSNIVSQAKVYFGPQYAIKLPKNDILTKSGLDRYENEISFQDGWQICHHKNGYKIYTNPKIKVITNPAGEIKVVDMGKVKNIYTDNGNQINFEISRLNDKPIAAKIYTEKYPKGIEIRSLAEGKKTGKYCSVKNNANKNIYYSYYGVTPDGTMKQYYRKKKADDEEFMARVMDSEMKYEEAAIPSEVLRAVYLGEI